MNPLAHLAWLAVLTNRLLGLLLLGLSCAGLLVLVKTTHRDDTGDHWIVTVISILFHAITFGVLRSSTLLTEPAREPRPSQKYEKSSLTEDLRQAAGVTPPISRRSSTRRRVSASSRSWPSTGYGRPNAFWPTSPA